MLSVLLSAHALYGHGDFSRGDLVSGPSVAYARDNRNDRSGYSFNVDTSISVGVFAVSINAKSITISSDYFLYGFQLEFTVCFLANWGGGIGYLRGNKKGRVYHTFIGFPIPLRGGESFVEPYCKCNYFRGDLYHEIGITIKTLIYQYNF